MSETRTVLITAGSDWADASADLLDVPLGMDLAAQKVEWRKWYQEEYCSYFPSLKKWNGFEWISQPKYISFPQWLKQHGAVDSECEQFEDT